MRVMHRVDRISWVQKSVENLTTLQYIIFLNMDLNVGVLLELRIFFCPMERFCYYDREFFACKRVKM